MKKINLISAAMLICCVSFFNVSCKKNTASDTTVVEESAQARVQSGDNEMISGETDAVDDNVNNAIANSERLCGAGNVFSGSPFTMPDATIVFPTASSARLSINFNGNYVGGCKKRNGTIHVDLLQGKRWVDTGAVLKYTFVNFKVEDICRNRSVTINGERYVTNVSGGNLFRLKNNMIDSLIHKVRTGTLGLEATFTDSSGSKTAVWNIARRTVIRQEMGNYFFKVDGDTTVNGKDSTESWGTTRFGKAYQSVISNSIRANTVCYLWRPKSGEVQHFVGNSKAVVTFGTNALGVPVLGPNCPEYFKVAITTGAGNTYTSINKYR